MVATYVNAVGRQVEKAKGLETTHQGGEAYRVDAFKQLRRFLILGSEGGTFYVSEKALTDYNIKSVKDALAIDGIRVVDEIVDVSDRGLAPKNDPALLALALAASDKDMNVRSYALANLSKVARTGTHLFHFATYVNALRGWGSALTRSVGAWYTERSDMSLANQVTKYQQRDGWSHADLLRLSHPKPKSYQQNAIFKYVVDGELPQGEETTRALAYLEAVESIKNEKDEDRIIHLIADFNLPREVLPTQALVSAKVWDALLHAGEGMPMTAMIRNLATMSKIGLLTQGSDAAKFVMSRLQDEEAIRKARVHPVDMIKAKLTYQSGYGFRSDATWTPVRGVTDALESGFYLAFGNVEPTNKSGLLALDVSGSMGGGEVAGVRGFSPRIASAVMAMVTARRESDYEILGFAHRLITLNISKHDSLDAVIRTISGLPFGGTDCALPMKYAIENGRKFDYFAVYTDSETGGDNPSDWLRKYRSKSGIHDAKLIVNAMVASWYSIADPRDPNMLDVVGFDSSAPQVMSAFIRGEV